MFDRLQSYVSFTILSCIENIRYTLQLCLLDSILYECDEFVWV